MTNILNTVLITGGAKRIGAGVAKTLAANGFKLAIHYNKSRKQANELCSELNSKKKKRFLQTCYIDSLSAAMLFTI